MPTWRENVLQPQKTYVNSAKIMCCHFNSECYNATNNNLHVFETQKHIQNETRSPAYSYAKDKWNKQDPKSVKLTWTHTACHKKETVQRCYLSDWGRHTQEKKTSTMAFTWVQWLVLTLAPRLCRYPLTRLLLSNCGPATGLDWE